MTTRAPLIAARGLGLRVGAGASPRVLLQGLDWQATRGERWAVIGRNGAGKSTLLRALAGLRVPQRDGHVDWRGRAQDSWPAPEAALLRAYVPQQGQDRFAMPVHRALELSAGPRLRAPAAFDAHALLAPLDAAHLAQQDVCSLSGGERQRVALAQCAAQDVPLMLLDEPVSFQDPGHRQLVARWLMAKGGDACIVFTAHDPDWIAGTATHVLALLGGGAWQAGPVAALDAALLERVYGCRFERRGGGWAAA